MHIAWKITSSVALFSFSPLSWAVVCTANSSATLISAINTLNAGNCDANTITVTSNITLAANLPVIAIPTPGSTAIITAAASRTIDGTDLFRIFATNGTSLSVNNIVIEDGRARGGDGASAPAGGGGGGLGAGGGIYVDYGQTVTLTNTTITSSSAVGGDGATTTGGGASSSGGGGGGASWTIGSAPAITTTGGGNYPGTNSTGGAVASPAQGTSGYGGGNGAINLAGPAGTGGGNGAGANGTAPAGGNGGYFGGGGGAGSNFGGLSGGGGGGGGNGGGTGGNNTSGGGMAAGGGGYGSGGGGATPGMAAGAGGGGGLGGGGGGGAIGQNTCSGSSCGAGAGGGGGWGGGGGGSGNNTFDLSATASQGGRYGGNGGPSNAGSGGGGGGGGVGGGVFVGDNATLRIGDGVTISGNSVTGGTGVNGGTNGTGYAADLFLFQQAQLQFIGASGGTYAFAIQSDTVASGVNIDRGVLVNASNPAAVTVLTSASNNYKGGTTIQSGILQVASDAILGTTSGGLALTGGTFQPTASFTLNSGRAVSTTSLNSTLLVDTGVTFNITTGITGAGGINKTGAGTLTLSGTNTYTGMTTVAAGTVTLMDTATITGALTVNGGAVGVRGTAGVSSAHILGDITINGGSVTFGNTSGGVPSRPTEVDSANIAVNNGGTLNLSDSVTIGDTNITIANGGSLVCSNGSSTLLGTGDAVIVNNGTIGLGAIGHSFIIGDLSGFGTITLGGSGTTNLNVNSALTVGETRTISGVISQNGQVQFAGQGTTILGNDNTYTGNTTVQSGTLQLGTTPGFSGSVTGNIVVNSGATLDVYGSTSNGSPNTLSNSGTVRFFGNQPSGSSTNMTTNTGVFDISGSPFGASIAGIGSTNGSGSVILGSKSLQIGANNSTIGGQITGTGSIAYNGGGNTLTITGNNTGYSGQTIIDTGSTLRFQTNGSLPASPVVSNGGIISMNIDATIGGLSGSGSVALGGRTLTVQGSGSTTYSGVINGGSLTYAGSGLLALTAQNTFNGATTVSSGTLQIGDAVTTGSNAYVTSGGNIGISSGGTLAVYGQTNNGVTQNILTNNGTLRFLGPASSAALTDVRNHGIMDISLASADVTIGRLSGNAGSSITLGANTLNINVITDGNVSYRGIISGVGGGIDYNGGINTLILYGLNTYTGNTSVSSGTLQIGDNTAPGQTAYITSSTGGITVDSGATLAVYGSSFNAASNALSNNGTVRFLGSASSGALTTITNGASGLLDISSATSAAVSIGGLTGGGTVTLGSRTLNIGANPGNFTGVISGVGGSINYAGGGNTLTLAGANTYSGTTTITSGTLTLTGSLASTSSLVNDAIFNMSGAGNVAITNLNGATPSANIQLGNNDLTVSGSGTYAGFLSGTGDLLYTGSGTLTLGGANTYTGLTSVAAGGTLALTGSLAATSDITNNGTFNISGASGNVTVDQFNGTNAGALFTLGTRQLIVNDSGSYNGVIAGTGGVDYNGATTLTFSNANTYSGLTTVNSGTLALTGSGNLANSPLLNDGNFSISGVSGAGATINGLGSTGASTIALGTKTLTVTGNTQANTYLGVISGTGGLTYAGNASQVLTLNGQNTYTGATTVSTGILQIGDNAHTGANAYVTSSTGNISVASGATLAVYGQTFNGANNTLSNSGTLQFLGGASSGALTSVTNSGAMDISSASAGVSVRGIAGSGTIALGLNTLTVGATSGTVSGVISGVAGGLTYNGGVGNTLTLTAANTYTGLTTISTDSTIALTGNGNLASSPLFNDGGTFDISGVSGSGAGIFGLSGSGDVILGTKTLTVQGPTQLPAFSGDISGTGGLTYNGTGFLFLSGVNSYTGLTTISAGTIALTTGGSIAGSAVLNNSAMDISTLTGAGTTINGLGGTGTIGLGTKILTVTGETQGTAYSGVMSGTGGLIYAGDNVSQVLTLNGQNTYTGATTVTSGTLQIGDITHTGANAYVTSSTGNIAVDPGAILSVYGQTFNGLANTLSNSGTVQFHGGASSGALTNITTNSGMLDISAATAPVSIAGIGSVDGSGDVALGSNTLNIGANTSAVSGVIAGVGGGITYAGGANTLTLSGANTYSGTTRVTSGSVVLTGSVASSSSLVNDAIFDMTGASGGTVSITNLNGTTALADIQLGANTLTVSGSGSYAGILSGTGDLTYNGASTLTLGGANTYTGLTSIAAGGTVALTGSLAATSDMTNNGLFNMSGAVGNVTFNDFNGSNSAAVVSMGSRSLIVNGAGTYNGAITGTGGVEYAGAGILTLNGINSYVGATDVSSGTLAVGDVSHTTAVIAGPVNIAAASTMQGYGAVNGNILNDGTITSYFGTLNGIVTNNDLLELQGSTTSQLINNGDAYYYSTANGTLITNNNYLEFNGAGATAATATIHNADTVNFVSGATAGASVVNNNGTLVFADNSSAGSATINQQSGTLVFEDTTTANNATVASTGGTIDISGMTAPILTIGRLYGDVNITLGANELRVGSLNTNDTITGTISSLLPGYASLVGPGFIKTGTGTLILNSINAYTGTTTVEQGTLLLGGDPANSGASIAGSAIVNAGASFGGFGTVSGSLTSSGNVQPGNSVTTGTLTVLQDYTQSSSGTYTLTIFPSSSPSLLAVTGNVFLDGTLIIENSDPNFQLGTPVDFITAAGGVSGQFSNIIKPLFLDLQVVYNANSVAYQMSFNVNEILAAAQTPNEYAVASYIVATGGNSLINSTLLFMDSTEEYRTFLDQLSGATYANQQWMLASASRQFENNIASRLNKDVWCFLKDEGEEGQSQESCNNQSYWMTLLAGRDQLLDTFDVSGLNNTLSGAALGGEIPLNDNIVLGAAMGYTNLNESANGSEEASMTGGLYQGGLYARYDLNNWRVGAEVDYGIVRNVHATREIDNTTLGTVKTEGSYEAPIFGTQIYTSYDLSFWNTSLRPTLGYLYQKVSGLDFTESSDTSLELHITGQQYTSSRSQVGLSLDTGLFTYIHPIFYIAWEHEFADINSRFTANIVNLPEGFFIEGTAIGRNGLYIDTGIAFFSTKGLSVSLEYQGRFAKETNQNTLAVSVGFK